MSLSIGPFNKEILHRVIEVSCHAYSIYIYIPTVEGPAWLNELGSWIT
jgi:hypothetical protein